MKFGRRYKLDVFNPNGNKITIELPFTVQFNIGRNVLASANTGTFTIFNLGADTRNQMYKDRYTTTEYWKIEFWAGYGDWIYRMFSGNALEIYSVKSGSDWNTVISCFDGMDGIQNGFTSETIAAQTSKREVFKRIIADMPNLTDGIIGSLGDDSAPRGKALLGQSSAVLYEETGGSYFIDFETVNVLTDEEIIGGDVVVLDPGQLLQTPRRRDSFIEIQTLLEPRIQLGRVYEIRSLESRFNGQYAVKGFSHSGIVSDSATGPTTTSISLYYGALSEVA